MKKKKKQKSDAETKPVEDAEPQKKKPKRDEGVEGSDVPQQKKKKRPLEETESKNNLEVKDVSVQKKKKRKLEQAETKQVEAEGEPSQDEAERRKAAQRKIQQLVLKLKAEGKSQAQIEAAKKDLKKELGSLRKEDGHRQRKSQEYWEKKQEKSKDISEEEKNQLKMEAKTRKHDVVVIPVLWRGRHDAEDLIKAAQEVKNCVAQQGVDVWIDSRRHYTPGQKFAHWEHRGVMLRVEIGPQDLEKGMCQVCLAKEPGEYKTVEKTKVRLPPPGARQLLLALKERGLSQIAIDRREGDDEEGDEDDVEANASTSKPVPTPSGDDLGGNWTPRDPDKQKNAKTKKTKKGKRT